MCIRDSTKESGFYRTRLDARRAPERVLMDPVRYGTPTKADRADVYMLTKSTFRDFPNLWVCLLYTSDAADERSSVDLGGRRIIKKKNQRV